MGSSGEVDEMKTVKEWKARLRPQYVEALEENGFEDTECLSPREVLDVIVDYEGGMGSGYEIVCMVNEIWGGQLPSEPSWEVDET